MKKTISAMFLFAAVLLMLVMSFAGCAAKEAADAEQSRYVGKWVATKVKVGDSDTLQPIDDFSDSVFTAEFKSNGRCEYTIDNTSWKDTPWEETEDGVKIMNISGTIYVTANEDGTLSVDYEENGVSIKLIFERE